MREFRVGEGKISGTLSIFLALLSIGGVLCFHYPEYLTTPELRTKYNVEVLRITLRACMFLSVAFGTLTFFLWKGKRLGFAGIFLTIVAQLLGGATIDVGEFESSRISFGLDWLVLDLLSSSLIFIFLEKLFPQNPDKKIFRNEWKNDLTYFSLNHLMISYNLLIVNKFSETIFGWAVSPTIQGAIRSQPAFLQFVEIIVVADLAQYWFHRGMHEIPFLWNFHAVHHSPPEMDWLSGSRLHFMELLSTRVLMFLPLFLLGFSGAPLNAYIVFVGFQAVLNHANVDIPFGFLRHVFVTPHFHHWHHSADAEAIDLNYAAHIPVLDRLFGTYLDNKGRWPAAYGVVGKTLPPGLIKQHLYPFKAPKEQKKAG